MNLARMEPSSTLRPIKRKGAWTLFGSRFAGKRMNAFFVGAIDLRRALVPEFSKVKNHYPVHLFCIRRFRTEILS